MTLTAARQVADAVLYEGYLLYPYRASSRKNQVRWQFGVLGPQGAAEAGLGEAPALSSEVLLEVPSETLQPATVDVVLRFLQVQSRVVERLDAGGWTTVDELQVESTRWVPFHEAAAREVTFPGLTLASLDRKLDLSVEVPSGQDVEELHEAGRVVGRLVRTRWALRAAIRLAAAPGSDPRAVVLRVEVRNATIWSPQPASAGWNARDLTARFSLVGTHLLLTARGAAFVPLLDPPEWAAADARGRIQQRCWPALIADDAGTDAVLVSPIILGDHPSIAPESAGDLFDATEIDEILTLRVMTLTEQEKADARGTDPRAAAILARCDSMTDDALDRLHGGRRPAPAAAPGAPEPIPTFADLLEQLSLEQLPHPEAVDADPTRPNDPARTALAADDPDDMPWWNEGRDARADPTTDTALVAGTRVSRGSRVLLRPTHRADAQDLFLAGLTATIARVYFDVDGGTHLAVMLEDDPGGDLYDTTGRYYYFAPDEVEPLPARTSAGGAR